MHTLTLKLSADQVAMPRDLSKQRLESLLCYHNNCGQSDNLVCKKESRLQRSAEIEFSHYDGPTKTKGVWVWETPGPGRKVFYLVRVRSLF